MRSGSARRTVPVRLLPLLGVWSIAAALLVAAPAHAAFPGANGKIAFYSNRDGNLEIYTMNPDGFGQTRLTNNAAVDLDPAWSPDGTKIAFFSDRDGNGEVYVMNADGSGQTRLTNNAASDGCPAWSPDGTKIAFVSNRDGNGEVYVMNANGTEQVNRTMNAADEGCPAWSPDGSTIAFPRDVGACCGRLDIYVMNSDGSGQTPLITSPLHDNNPKWSPDGSKIAFDSDRGQLFSFDVYSANADGSGQMNLTNNPAPNDVHPAWSPDGTKIAFFSDRDANGEIYVMNPDGSGQINLTNNPTVDGGPDWQPVSTPGCKVTGGGRITADNGDKATFGGNANVSDLGVASGSEEYRDHGPAQSMRVKSTQVLAVICSSNTQASIFGLATIDGSGLHFFKIDVQDLGEPGVGTDTFRILLDTGYDSGVHTLVGGNVQIHDG